MKKQLADQGFHDRRHQERMRAEAAKKAVAKKAAVAAVKDLVKAEGEAPVASPQRSGTARG